MKKISWANLLFVVAAPLASGALLVKAPLAMGDDKTSKGVAKKGKAVAIDRFATFSPEREAAALAFVKENHPELGDVLATLKQMRRDDYERAILSLFSMSENLTEVKTRDPKRHDYLLRSWQTKSRIDLLSAKARMASDDATLEQLRVLLKQQRDLEIQQHEAELARLKERSEKLEADIARLKSDQDRVIEARIQALAKRKGKPTNKSAGKKVKDAPATSAP